MAVIRNHVVHDSLKGILSYVINNHKMVPEIYFDMEPDPVPYNEEYRKEHGKIYIAGINCSTQNTLAEMQGVQLFFPEKHCPPGKRPVKGYHISQSFKGREVDGETALKIGTETALEMWGSRHQVLVAVHFNRNNTHCHFVINSISFVDGLKIPNKIKEHFELREISDRICAKYNASVIEGNKMFTNRSRAYWVGKTEWEMAKDDLEFCISHSCNYRDLCEYMRSIGYILNPEDLTISIPDREKKVHMIAFKYTRESLEKCFEKNLRNPGHLAECNANPPYTPRDFPLKNALNELEYDIENSTDTATVLLDVLFYTIISMFEIAASISDFAVLSPELRHKVKYTDKYWECLDLLKEDKIDTLSDIKQRILSINETMDELNKRRNKIKNKICSTADDSRKKQFKEERSGITAQMAELRKNLKLYKFIQDAAPALCQYLRTEIAMEREAYTRNRKVNRDIEYI